MLLLKGKSRFQLYSLLIEFRVGHHTAESTSSINKGSVIASTLEVYIILLIKKVCPVSKKTMLHVISDELGYYLTKAGSFVII